MTNPRYQHDIVVMDRSGSIREILQGMQEGFREFISAQGALHVSQGGELESVTASLWQFDDKIDQVGSFEPVGNLASYMIVPRGNTALYDAIGRAVTTEGEALAAMSEDQRPGQVVVIIASDGRENWSKEWDGGKVRELLERQQRDYGWQVIYLGTNQDAFSEARKIGAQNVNSVLSYKSSNAGTQKAWRGTSAAVGRFSHDFLGAGVAASVSYNDEERTAAQADDEK